MHKYYLTICTTSMWTFFFRLFLFVHMWWNAGEPHCDHRQHWQKVFLDGLGQEPHSSTKGLTSPPSWPFSFSFRSSSLSSLSSPILDHNNHQDILYIVQHRACTTSFRGSRSSWSFSSFLSSSSPSFPWLSSPRSSPLSYFTTQSVYDILLRMREGNFDIDYEEIRKVVDTIIIVIIVIIFLMI